MENSNQNTEKKEMVINYYHKLIADNYPVENAMKVIHQRCFNFLQNMYAQGWLPVRPSDVEYIEANCSLTKYYCDIENMLNNIPYKVFAEDKKFGIEGNLLSAMQDENFAKSNEVIESDKYYIINAKFENKDYLKSIGCRWDSNSKLWYSTKGKIDGFICAKNIRY